MEEKGRYEIYIYDDICVDLYDNGVLDKSINDTYKLEKLLNQLDKENKQLKQQLHDLPKKIIGEIKNNCWYGGAWLEDNYYKVTDKLLYTILKKFGGKNESKGDVGE